MCGYSAPDDSAAGEGIPPVMETNIRRELEHEFRIERVLGRGGMSIVYLARELELNRLVAIKVLPLQLQMGPDAADRFKREAKIAASLDHPHIVPIHRVGTTDTFMWYSMKWVKGRSLRNVVKETGPMSLEDVLRVIEPVAGALDHAHRRGIVHRDVKPENVLIDEVGWVTVCDFGIAKAFGSTPLTQSGGTLGTPAYMSTEQCYGQALDGRSDQYSLAVLTYECLAGVLPFQSESLGDIVRQHCMEPPPRITSSRADLPEPVADAILTAMSKQPNDRFETVLDFVQALGAPPARATPTFTTVPTQETLATAPTEMVGTTTARIAKRFAPATFGAALLLAVFVIVMTTRSPTGAGESENSTPTGPAAIAAPETTVTRDTAPPDPGAQSGFLFVASNPWGHVYVDGERVGETPLASYPLEPGRHELSIEREGYEPFRQVLEVTAGQEVRLTRIVLNRVNTP
jgi:serine/threonine-protein kinase